MTTESAQPHASGSSADAHQGLLQRCLLACGIAGAALYPLTDIIATTRYAGFSYRDQAVSELFAIGAPTSAFVVRWFSISSALLLLFAIGIWRSANGRRVVEWLAAMMALNALDALVLWNFFPMHMRGSQPTSTDMMHGLLAVDPFLLAAMVLAAIAFRSPFRVYTVATIVFTSALAMLGLSHATAVFANQPTPWMGATERAAQYATNLWYAVFAVKLLREPRSVRSSAGSWWPNLRIVSNRLGLACGILSALLYATMLVIVPLGWSGYSSASQTVSELSAIDAPTRTLWVSLGLVWAILYGAFGASVWSTSDSSKPLRVAGGSILAAAVAGVFWPPMHLREVLAAGGGTSTDTLHIIWTVANAVFTVAAMGFAAAALGRAFRIYSIATIAILLAAGVATSMDASRLEANLPTPWMGAWERINIAAWLLWTAVLSAMLTARSAALAPRSTHGLARLRGTLAG